MSFSEEDDDIKQAIALSLQSSTTTNNNVINLDSDDDSEDEDLKLAMALSRGEQGLDDENVQQTSGTAHTSSSVQADLEKPPTNSFGIPGLDRKAMEEERIARLGKRKRDPSPEQPKKQTTKRQLPWESKSESESSTQSKKQATKAPATSLPDRVPPRQPLNDTVKEPGPSTHGTSCKTNSTLEFPNGVIRRTAGVKYPRKNDITFSELVQSSDVHIAVISAFQWEAEWLTQKLSPSRVKQIWIMNAKGNDVQARWRQEMEDCGIPNMKLHFPPMGNPINSSHSKYMLLFGKEKLRLVVQTANMGRVDWGEVPNQWQPGVLENMVFVIDLPRRGDGKVGKTTELTCFGKELIYFLERQKIDNKVIEGALKFDFAATGRLGFVHSIGGYHNVSTDRPTGLLSLAKAVCDLGLDDVQSLELDYAAASLGILNDTFLQHLYVAAQGLPLTSSTSVVDVRKRIRIYFPTDETVKNSIGGPDAAGIISMRKKFYNTKGFPRECLRDHVSTRGGMLSHSKLLFARGRKKDGQPFAWVYVGSANLSESAWGTAGRGRSGDTQIIRNWECGITVPVPADALQDVRLAAGEVPPMSVFAGTIEVPFEVPGAVYGGRQPWFFMDEDRC